MIKNSGQKSRATVPFKRKNPIFVFSRKFRENFRENFCYFCKEIFAKSENKFSRKYENENFRFNPSSNTCFITEQSKKHYVILRLFNNHSSIVTK